MTQRNVLSLSVKTDDGGEQPLEFEVRQVVNVGYAGRDRQAVLAHIEELRREGVEPPRNIPALYSVSRDNITTGDRIEVIGDRTSGEVEYVLLVDGQSMYVGVGSDHTDRALEAHSVIKSKQVCANVMSSSLWRYEDVRDRWDDLVLQSWVRPVGGGEEVLYQSGPLGSLLTPAALLDLIRSRYGSVADRGLIVYSGTVAAAAGELICGELFRGELIDPATGRKLSVAYRTERLEDLGD